MTKHRRAWLIYAPAAFFAMGETTALMVLGPKGSAPLGPQVTAPPLFDIFHDLRWISVYHSAWWNLAGLLVLSLLVRAAWCAWILRAAWPDEHRPAFPIAFARALAFYAVAAALMMPWVFFFFAFDITGLSWLFFTGFPIVLGIVFAIHRGAFAHGAGWWWWWNPSRASLGWMFGALVWLTVAGAIIVDAPRPLGILTAGVAGLLAARANIGIVEQIHQGQDHPRPVLQRLIAPLAVVGLVAIAVGGAAAGFAEATTKPPHGTPVSVPARASGHPVLVVAGYNSRWQPRPSLHLPTGFVAWRYSYRGIAPDGEILPYDSSDTLQSLAVSAAKMNDEVDALRRAYGEPVAIVGDSEGALIARMYLVRYRPIPTTVDAVVILGMPPVHPGAYYPLPGQQGWGVGSGYGLRGLSWVVGRLSPIEVPADSPFIRGLFQCRSLTDAITDERPPPGIVQISVHALTDAVGADAMLADADVVIAGTHGGLIRRAKVAMLINDFLQGKRVAPAKGLRELYRGIALASAAWRPPPLQPGLAPQNRCLEPPPSP